VHALLVSYRSARVMLLILMQEFEGVADLVICVWQIRQALFLVFNQSPM